MGDDRVADATMCGTSLLRCPASTLLQTFCLLGPAAPFCRHNRTNTLNTTTLEDPRPPKRYELTVHNRFIGVCAQAATLEEMANALRAQAELFEALNDPRIEYDTTGWEDDYHYFYTDDDTIAEKFGFDEITDEDDDGCFP